MNQRQHWWSNASSSTDGEEQTALRNGGALVLVQGTRQLRPKRDVAILGNGKFEHAAHYLTFYASTDRSISTEDQRALTLIA
jgi:hypothetical protein